jgi:hypothetical protein
MKIVLEIDDYLDNCDMVKQEIPAIQTSQTCVLVRNVRRLNSSEIMHLLKKHPGYLALIAGDT